MNQLRHQNYKNENTNNKILKQFIKKNRILKFEKGPFKKLLGKIFLLTIHEPIKKGRWCYRQNHAFFKNKHNRRL